MHSVFERAVNLVWHDGSLVTLHGPAPLAAPFAAAIARLPQAGSLTPGTAVRRRGSRIMLGPFVLDIAGGTQVDTTVHPTDEAPGLLASTLASMPRPAVAPGLSSPTGRWAQHRLASGMRRWNPQALVEGACALIGLGEGLTPAGDDCLVGALAILHRFRDPWLACHPEINASITVAARVGTTIVGRDFILHALEGAFSETILRLVTAATAHDVCLAVAALAETGGTSGADTLDGMRIALETLSP